jgi:hypothetical protein
MENAVSGVLLAGVMIVASACSTRTFSRAPAISEATSSRTAAMIFG